jgi:hypothetical protein
MQDNILPWMQQPNEPDDMFKLFDYYLSLRSRRSFQLVAHIFGISRRSVASYAKKYNWFHRACLYEDYIKENVKYPVLDYFQSLDDSKYEAKINLSKISLAIIETISPYLNDYSKIYDNPVTLQKVKFIREVASTLNLLYKMLDFSLDKKMLNIKFARDLTIDEIINPGSQKNKLTPGELKNIQAFLNELISEAENFTEKNGAISANNDENICKPLLDNKIQNL